MSDQGYQPNSFAFDGASAPRLPGVPGPAAGYQDVGASAPAVPPPATPSWTPSVMPSGAPAAPAPAPAEAFQDFDYSSWSDDSLGEADVDIDGGFDSVAARFDAPEALEVSESPETTHREFELNEVLIELLERGGSDLHLTTGASPAMRVSGELVQLDEYPKLTPLDTQRVLYAVLTQKQREKFEENLELDLAYAVPGHARFRVNVYRQRESLGAAFRVIPYEIKPLEDLGVPPVVNNFAGLPRGMVLVTGPTGSGKSTTLAAVVDQANRTRKDHIMTVEDPIEFLHHHKGCIVNQREVGEDTKSFANALKHVLRQDPDIILVGEMRDLETIHVALTAAETGHLVFGTLHTQDAAQTIDRVIDVFPPHQQQQVRTQLAGAIQGVVCQTLCKKADGRGRVVATEVMVATPAIRNLIREGKTHQIYSAMQAGAQHGMHTLDQHLAELVRTGQITWEHGLEKCHHVEDYQRLTGRG
ncbi:type IV pilus twitching motility protein PilT [Aquipuribacter sp. SD81]|uniref:type IV pilus twitching motility protein PilT n=1 Tax=Aquipuribacter sp. SD81 TaxID=3127703 RepID=UPI00301631D4